MRKLLFGAVALLLMASCAGNGGSEKAGTDSSQTTDSPVQTVDAAQAKAEQARQDSIRQDSITKAEKTAKEEKAASQYDGMIKEYVTTVNSFAKVSKNVSQTGNYSKGVALLQKCWKQEEKINKVKSKLSPSQLEQFKKAKAKFNKANAPGRYAG